MNDNQKLNAFINRIHGLFNNKRARKTLLKFRIPIGLLFFVIISMQIKPSLFFTGLSVSVLGEILQIWCLAALKKKKRLTIEGPYMFMRNPMYIGRFFLLFGIILMTGNWWFIICFVIVYYFYMVNRVKREEKVLLEIFGKDYESYSREVNRFIPSLRRFDPNLLWLFNKDSFLKNHAHWNLLGVAAGYIILYSVTFLWPTR
jgi:hypothetical protein